MPSYNNTVRSDRMTVVNTASAGGKLALYDGTKPAPGGAATTKLAEFSLSTPAGTVTNGVLTFTDPANVTVLANGTCTWARITNSGGSWVGDFTASKVGGSGEIKLTENVLTTGMTLDVTSLTITEGNA
ncbi:hypothetical protein UFOVP686_31 [uncultured Caudovirales phage]|uniref:Uncharacterized protein n=1 Tax=uncultured Caudovirales phage TaxID=2100421 RepID=A0A6J5ND31_9CAUD|nr:hypothetical protein UFOVP686_31 [uncultured Caudovirales phage]CAB5225563.1 hypothetical protein UFOVP752_35 [uncultured Caudovirales phage]